jgi:LmbE family N-acetylglucosaminyl deacetylase
MQEALKNMNRSFTAFLFLAILSLMVPSLARAVDDGQTPSIDFTAQDRVLVIAPHPDDESIAAAGVIQQTIKAGGQVKVCLMTQGENNEFAFIVYERRIVLKPKEFLRLGEVRRQETIDAMRVLGVPSENVVSLGYPDYGTMELFLKYWGEVKPFRSMLSRVRKVPYPEALSPNASYIGDNALNDLKKVIEDFKPTKIFVSHPGDVNRDHRAVYLFTRVALWDLEAERKIQVPLLYPYIIHVPSWPIPRGYHPELALNTPPVYASDNIRWVHQILDPLETGKKYDAVLEYPSQIKYAPRYLVTFARKNELFGDFPSVVLEKQMASDAEITWASVSGPKQQKSRLKSDATNHFSGTEYARQGNFLLIRLLLRRAIDRELGVSVSLMGYSNKVPFSQMPKIALMVGINGFHIKDKKKTVPSKDVIFIQKEKELYFKISLSLLGDPDKILTSAKTALYDLTFDETAWRVLELP